MKDIIMIPDVGNWAYIAFAGLGDGFLALVY
jgi:hypothetical protein